MAPSTEPNPHSSSPISSNSWAKMNLSKGFQSHTPFQSSPNRIEQTWHAFISEAKDVIEDLNILTDHETGQTTVQVTFGQANPLTSFRIH